MAQKLKLKDYQKETRQKMLEGNKALFMGVGCGKTATSLSVVTTQLKKNPGFKALVVAPLFVAKAQWPKEIEQWLQFDEFLNPILFHGDLKSLDTLESRHHNVVIINPAGLETLRDIMVRYVTIHAKSPFVTLVCDESTMFGAHNSNQTKLIHQLLPFFKHRYILSGSPTANHPLKLWSQIYILDEGESLGTNFYKDYRNVYFEQCQYTKAFKLIDGAMEEIADKIKHLTITIDTIEHNDLPELIHRKVDIKLPKKLIEQYKILEKELMFEDENLGAELEAVNALSATGMLMQFTGGRMYDKPSIEERETWTEEEMKRFMKNRKVFDIHEHKVKALVELAETTNKPLLVAYWFKPELKLIKKHLPNAVVLDKNLPQEELLKIIKDWNEGKIKVLLGQPASMGHGLNLQKCEANVCFYTQSHFEHCEQLIGRVHRPGNNSKTTEVFYLLCDGTVDEKIFERNRERDIAQASFKKKLKRRERVKKEA